MIFIYVVFTYSRHTKTNVIMTLRDTSTNTIYILSRNFVTASEKAPIQVTHVDVFLFHMLQNPLQACRRRLGALQVSVELPFSNIGNQQGTFETCCISSYNSTKSHIVLGLFDDEIEADKMCKPSSQRLICPLVSLGTRGQLLQKT